MRRAVLAAVLSFVLMHTAAGEGQPPSAAALAEGLAIIEELRSKGEIDKAIEMASLLRGTHPAELTVHLAYQDLCLARGAAKELLLDYSKRATAAEATADDHFLYGRLLNGSRAIGEYRRALSLDSRHFHALCALATEEIQREGFTAAEGLLSTAIRLRPESAVPLNLTGWMAERMGDPSRAEASYRAAMEKDAKSVLPRVNLGILLVRQKRTADAEKLLKEARALAPKDPLPLIGLGMARAAAGKTADALALYQKAVLLDPDTVTSLSLLGSAYLGLEQYGLARESFEKALRIAPEDVPTMLNLGYTCLLEGKVDAGKQWGEKAVALRPESAECHYFLGLCQEYDGQAKSAEREYGRAMELDPDEPDYPRAVGALLQNLGRLKEAIAAFTRAADLSGNAPACLLDLAFAFLAAGEPKRALSCFEEVLEQDPANLKAWMNVGLIWQEHFRNREKAIAAYEEYLAHGGRDPRVQRWLDALKSE